MSDVPFAEAAANTARAVGGLGINDPVINTLRAQIEENARHPEPERKPFSLKRTQAFLWRSRPGTLRKLRIKIPGIPAQIAAIDEFHGIKVIKNYGERFQKIYDRKHTPELREMFDAALLANNGAHYVEFIELSQTFECYFETDEPAIADFMRWYLSTHPKVGQYVYEDLGIQMLKSRYTSEEFPNTEAGRQKLFAFDREIEKVIAEQARPVPPTSTPEQVDDVIRILSQIPRGEAAGEYAKDEETILDNVAVPPQDVTQAVDQPGQPTAQGQGKVTPKTGSTTRKG